MTGAGTDNLLGRFDSLSGGEWYLTDSQGSVRQVVDSVDGSTEGSASYDALGNLSSSTGGDLG